MSFSWPGAPVTFSNVFHVQAANDFSGNDLVVLATALRDWDLTYYRVTRSQYITLDNIYCRALHAAVAPAYSLNPGPGHAGAMTGGLGSLNVTKAIKLQSASSGRSQRGRVYPPPLAKGSITANTYITAAWGNSLLTAFIELIGALHELTPYMQLGIASYRTGHAWRPYATFVPAETAVIVGLRVDTQRRRLGPRPPI